MRKICYPVDSLDREKFNTTYIKNLEKKLDKKKINAFLSGLPSKKLDLKTFLTLPFEHLLKLINDLEIERKKCPKIKVGTKGKKVPESDTLFNYDSCQSQIASFFMNQSDLDFRTCFYCGIDHVNSFVDSGEYSDGIQFLNNACFSELIQVTGIGKEKAQNIINLRPHNGYEGLKLWNETKEKLRQSIYPKVKKNHFTLDHILPKSKYPFFGLCLYNLVPSCYACNSKFKKVDDFLVDTNLPKISPTSEKFELDAHLKFELYYGDKDLKDLTTESDFHVDFKIEDNHKHLYHYLCMFKLKGRYRFHKGIILDLIEKKVKYSESRIETLQNQTGLSKDDIRQLAFGKEFFDKEILDEPFLKFKRDIGKFIKLEGVVD